MGEKPEVWGRKRKKGRSHGWKDIGMHEGGPGGGLGGSTLPCIRASLGVQHCKHPKCLEATGRQGVISISMQNREKKVRNMNRQVVTLRMCKPCYPPVPGFPSTNIGNNFYQVSQMLESSAGLVKMLKNPQLSPDLESFGKSFAVHRVLIIYFSVLRRDLLHTPPPGEAEKSGM